MDNKNQIRVRLSKDDLSTLRRIARVKNLELREVVAEGIKRIDSSEKFLEALAGLEMRLTQRLNQLPTLVWREVLRQSAESKKAKGEKS